MTEGGHWFKRVLRTIAGIALVIFVGVTISTTEANLAMVRASPNPTVFQLMQVQLEGCFYVIAAVSVAIGVYIATRWE
jgi:predicted transporter